MPIKLGLRWRLLPALEGRPCKARACGPGLRVRLGEQEKFLSSPLGGESGPVWSQPKCFMKAVQSPFSHLTHH